MVAAEAALAIIFIISMTAMFYVYYKIMKLFNRLSDMPFQLSKGNLNDEIKENKNRYFGKFIWGIGMLKNNLEDRRNHEYKLVKDKKMLVLSISHDIKTPLNAINLYAKALESNIYNTDEERTNAIKMIQSKTLEIDDFVKEIEKSQTEDIISIEVKEGEFYLEELVNKVNSGYNEKCSIRKVDFVIGEYENHIISGDIDRIYEAVGNLMENAFKYGDGRKIIITFYEEDYCQLISVYNSGKSVDENEITHLFDSFFRGSNTSGKDGNGLGLYICSQIMHKMNGEILEIPLK